MGKSLRILSSFMGGPWIYIRIGFRRFVRMISKDLPPPPLPPPLALSIVPHHSSDRADTDRSSLTARQLRRLVFCGYGQ